MHDIVTIRVTIDSEDVQYVSHLDQFFQSDRLNGTKLHMSGPCEMTKSLPQYQLSHIILHPCSLQNRLNDREWQRIPRDNAQT